MAVAGSGEQAEQTNRAVDYSRWDHIDDDSEDEMEQQGQAERIGAHIDLEHTQRIQEVDDEVSAAKAQLAACRQQRKALEEAARVQRSQGVPKAQWMLMGGSSFVRVPSHTVAANVSNGPREQQRPAEGPKKAASSRAPHGRVPSRAPTLSHPATSRLPCAWPLAAAAAPQSCGRSRTPSESSRRPCTASPPRHGGSGEADDRARKPGRTGCSLRFGVHN